MQLLTIRYYQAKRDLGIWTLIIAIALFYLAFEITGNTNLKTIVAVPVITWLGLISHFNNRRDLNFVARYFHRPRLQIILNYNLFTLPISLGLILNGHWIVSLLLHVSVCFIGLIRFKGQLMRLAFITTKIPAKHFEWISGVRNHFYSIAILLLLSVILSPVKLFGIVPLFLLNSIFTSFYNYNEPIHMLNPGNFSAQNFLREKASFNSRMTLYFNLPLLAINSLFNHDAFVFNVLFLIVFMLIATTTVYLKYGAYKPNQNSTYRLEYFFLFSPLVTPWLLPISIFIFYSARRKAVDNLNIFF